MSKTEDIVKEAESLKNSLQQYLSYDSMVGGLISKSIKNLADAQELLKKKPTAKNVKEALAKAQTVKDGFAPYGSYAPEMMKSIDSLVEKISKLQKKKERKKKLA